MKSTWYPKWCLGGSKLGCSFFPWICLPFGSKSDSILAPFWHHVPHFWGTIFWPIFGYPKCEPNDAQRVPTMEWLLGVMFATCSGKAKHRFLTTLHIKHSCFPSRGLHKWGQNQCKTWYPKTDGKKHEKGAQRDPELGPCGHWFRSHKRT